VVVSGNSGLLIPNISALCKRGKVKREEGRKNLPNISIPLSLFLAL